MNGNKDNLFTSLKRDLEEDLKQLQKEKQEQEKTNQLKLVELRKSLSEEITQHHQKNRSEIIEMLEKREANLKKDLEHLINENKNELTAWGEKEIEIIRKELAEIEKKNAEKNNRLESKLTKFYYWLFGIVFIFLVIISGMFFYLRGSK